MRAQLGLSAVLLVVVAWLCCGSDASTIPRRPLGMKRAPRSYQTLLLQVRRVDEEHPYFASLSINVGNGPSDVSTLVGLKTQLQLPLLRRGTNVTRIVKNDRLLLIRDSDVFGLRNWDRLEVWFFNSGPPTRAATVSEFANFKWKAKTTKRKGRHSRTKRQAPNFPVISSPDESEPNPDDVVPPSPEDPEQFPDISEPSPDVPEPVPDESEPFPDVSIPVPGESETFPDAGSSSPDESGPSPDESEPSPDESGPSPDESGPSPDESGPSPDESGPLPDESVPSPDESSGPSPDEAGQSPDESVQSYNQTSPSPAPEESLPTESPDSSESGGGSPAETGGSGGSDDSGPTGDGTPDETPPEDGGDGGGEGGGDEDNEESELMYSYLTL